MTHTKKVLLTLSLAVAVLALPATSAFAQSATLACTPFSSTVTPNTNINFVISGSAGPFSISGTGVTATTTTSTIVTGNFSSTGTQSFTVTAGGQTATCSVNVQPAASNAVACSVPSGTYRVGQNVTFNATGGNGVYTWSATDLQISNPTGTGFTANYTTAGVHTVAVTSNGQTANCSVNILPAAGSPTDVLCSPSTQTATVGQQVTFNATGGNGSYVWSATDLQISNPTGTSFRATYANPGLHTIMVASNGLTSSCAVNVLAAGTTPVPPVVPGLPNTGFAPVQ